MSLQYIHTSAKRGLEPGKSGFCCVARDREISPDLIQELESQSRYHATSSKNAPYVLRHRISSLRSGVYHILSRIQDSGTDYSKRNNHLAHHLVFEASEVRGLPNPASILLNWKGWRSRWEEPPRTFSPHEAFGIQDMDTKVKERLGSTEFPSIYEKGQLCSRVFPIERNEERYLIEHLRSSLNELPTKNHWRYSFTSRLLPTDQPQDYVWCGAAKREDLPYELDLDPRPLEPPPRQKLSIVTPDDTRTNPNPKSQIPSSKTRKPGSSSPKTSAPAAPVVEIPEEYDRKQRKRPPRKLGKRELSLYINLAIAAAAVVCVLLLVWLYKTRLQSSPIKNAADSPSETAKTNDTPARQWLSFRQAGYPSSQLPLLAPVAKTLAKAGNPTPLAEHDFLSRLQALATEPNPNPLSVPSTLIRNEANSTHLSLAPSDYPALTQAALLPRDLLSPLQELANSGLAPSDPLDSLPAAQFSLASFQAALEAILKQADYAFQPPARPALDAYFAKKSEIESNPNFRPFLSLPQAFGKEPASAFIAFDPQSLLISSGETSYSRYLSSFFASYAFAHRSSTGSSTAFLAALQRVRSQEPITAYQRAEFIHQAIGLVEPSAPEDQAKWRKIQSAWQATFLRDDLMEQAIVGFTLEAMEKAKIELQTLQAQTTSRDILEAKRLRDLESAVSELVKYVKGLISNQEWIVIMK